MQTFIKDTISYLVNNNQSFENTIFVLPSQRAGVFLKNELREKMLPGFLPQIFTIEEFVETVSETKKLDSVQLLFHFYTIYIAIEKKPQPFETFASWAFTVLNDFNEIDQHLIDPKIIFTYLRDIHRLKNWKVNEPINETELMKNHFSFMEKLENYYTSLYHFLLKKRTGYQGFTYREAAKKIPDYIQKNQDKKFVLLGFNALNKAEEYIFQNLLEIASTEIFWDIDIAFLKNNHQAGSFIRKYKNTWKYYQKNDLKTIGQQFSKPKNIKVVGASKNVTQIKYVGELLEQQTNFSNTALVLADESLLSIGLNSLPKKIESINITMGYPLKNIPTSNLFRSIFQLFLTQKKLQKTTSQEFYYKDVLAFIKHSHIQAILNLEDEFLTETITNNIHKNNQTFLSFNQISKFFENLTTKNKAIFNAVFAPITSIDEFLNTILQLISVLKDYTSELEKEYLFRFYTIFSQIYTLQKDFQYIKDLKTLQLFFNQLISNESLFFQGEPLSGLQIMGMLETRMLDFENIIITSVNEGIIPKGNNQNSFIPFDVKVEIGLPIYKENDAIFSYHFFRLIQRAKNVFLIYNSEKDTFGGGEKSRFITQLMAMKQGITVEHIAPKIHTETNNLKAINKTEKVQIRLKKLAEKGFSPSALANYLYNPFDFYKQKVLEIYEFEEVEETVALNTMGTIIHDTLETLYKPFIGKYLTLADLKEMEKNSSDLVASFFKKHFNSSSFLIGKNRLIFEVSKRFVIRFIEKEKKIVANPKNQLKILATELPLQTNITIDKLDFPIKIKGIVDRIDQLNGITRIIDYKTGMVTSNDLKIDDFTKITQSYKYNKALQVLLYAFLYLQNNPKINEVEAGIISFKNLKNGFLKMNFSEKRNEEDVIVTREKLDEYLEVIKKLIEEIYDASIPFEEKIV